MQETYHIRIKKDYADAIIKDLQKMDALELLPENIPEWQMNIVADRLEEYKRNPINLLDFDEAMNDIEKEL